MRHEDFNPVPASRMAYLAPEVLKRLTCGREASAVSLYDLCFLAGVTWGEQFERVFD